MIQLENAQDFYNLIVEVRQKYREAGMPVILPKRQYIPSPEGYTSFSGMGYCHLQKAFQKNNVPPTHPQNMSENDEFSAHVMDRGTYTQAMFQEPFAWYAQRYLDVFALIEEQVISEAHKMNGYPDLIIGWRDIHGVARRAITEIKDSESPNGKLGTPRKGYALQLVGYSLVTGITDMYILINSKKGFNTYHMAPAVPNDPSAGFVVYERDGSRFKPDYGTNWNTPSTLSYQAVLDEAQSMRDYIDKVQEWQMDRLYTKKGLTPPAFEDSNIEVPYLDPLNNRTDGWACVSMPKDQFRKKTATEGIAIARCPFAGHCHGYKEGWFDIVRENGQLKVKQETPQW